MIHLVDRLIERKQGSSEKLISFVADRAGHDLRYAIDSSKIKDELGWEPTLQFEQGIEKKCALDTAVVKAQILQQKLTYRGMR